jgi:hypothetical protein
MPSISQGHFCLVSAQSVKYIQLRVRNALGARYKLQVGYFLDSFPSFQGSQHQATPGTPQHYPASPKNSMPVEHRCHCGEPIRLPPTPQNNRSVRSFCICLSMDYFDMNLVDPEVMYFRTESGWRRKLVVIVTKIIFKC